MTKQSVKRCDELAAELSEEGDEVVAAARTAGTIVRCPLVRCIGKKHFISHVVPQGGDDEDHFCEKLEGLTLDGSATCQLSLIPPLGNPLSA